MCVCVFGLWLLFRHIKRRNGSDFLVRCISTSVRSVALCFVVLGPDRHRLLALLNLLVELDLTVEEGAFCDQNFRLRATRCCTRDTRSVETGNGFSDGETIEIGAFFRSIKSNDQAEHVARLLRSFSLDQANLFPLLHFQPETRRNLCQLSVVRRPAALAFGFECELGELKFTFLSLSRPNDQAERKWRSCVFDHWPVGSSFESCECGCECVHGLSSSTNFHRIKSLCFECVRSTCSYKAGEQMMRRPTDHFSTLFFRSATIKFFCF